MNRADVMVLGTPHFANPGRDLINLHVDDVLAPGRQAELEDLVARLGAFRPTKVCVEATPVDQGKVDDAYSRYIDGTLDPRPSEIHQIAFRLARLCGLDRVSGIDGDAPMLWEELEAFFGDNPEEDRRFKAGVRAHQVEAEKRSGMIARTPVRQYLREMNAPEALRRDAAWYVDMAGLGEVGEHPGAEMLSSWYRRNVRIFSNLAGLTEDGDRIFVVIGLGHVPILNELLALSARHRLVEVTEYL